MFLSCIAVQNKSEKSPEPVIFKISSTDSTTTVITAGTSEVLGIRDPGPYEISVFHGSEKLGKLFIDLTEFEFCRPVGGMFVFDKAVMRLRRPAQLLGSREFNALAKGKSALVLTLVIMRLDGDPRPDSVRIFRDFAEKLATPSVRRVPIPQIGSALKPRDPVVHNYSITKGLDENADPATWRAVLEQRLAEKDAEIEELRREISRLRVRVEERLAVINP